MRRLSIAILILLYLALPIGPNSGWRPRIRSAEAAPSLEQRALEKLNPGRDNDTLPYFKVWANWNAIEANQPQEWADELMEMAETLGLIAWRPMTVIEFFTAVQIESGIQDTDLFRFLWVKEMITADQLREIFTALPPIDPPYMPSHPHFQDGHEEICNAGCHYNENHVWTDECLLCPPKGEDGKPGEDGEDGNDGAPGAPGNDGADGNDGAPGEPGEDGQDGADGEDGRPGRPGKPGKPGEDGDDGQDGAPGQPGTPGNPGEDGNDGTDGQPGEPGEDGEDGQSALERQLEQWINLNTQFLNNDLPVDQVAEAFEITTENWNNFRRQLATMFNVPDNPAVTPQVYEAMFDSIDQIIPEPVLLDVYQLFQNNTFNFEIFSWKVRDDFLNLKAEPVEPPVSDDIPASGGGGGGGCNSFGIGLIMVVGVLAWIAKQKR